MRQTRQRIHRRFREPCNLNLLNIVRGRKRGPWQRDVTTKPYETAVPGFWRTIRFIPAAKRVARTPEEFKPDRSTMSSICTALSELGNSYISPSDESDDAASRKLRRAGNGCSAFVRAAGAGVGKSSVTSSPWVTRLAPAGSVGPAHRILPTRIPICTAATRPRAQEAEPAEASNSLASESQTRVNFILEYYNMHQTLPGFEGSPERRRFTVSWVAPGA
jgi:hypothetical protein